MHALKKLRTAMGLSQAEFGQLVGRSHQSIRNYESGIPMPDDLREKIVSMAAARGFGDIAIELRGGQYEAKRVLQPGETLITSKQKRGEPPASSIIPPPPVPKAARKMHFQRLLDMILDSGMADAIEAVERNLEVFAKYVKRSEARGVARRAKGA
jgi:transcriptional regulator with XRE-family HTH domain